MNPAFQEALAARLKWIDVVVLDNIEGCEAQAEDALQTAYDAVHELASNDVLKHQHYGPRAPLMLLDVPELAEQYNLSHELYTELYHKNYHDGALGELAPDWLVPAEPLALPYTKWLAVVTGHLAAISEEAGTRAEDAIQGQARTLLSAWTQGLTPEAAADEVHAAYECQKEFEEEEAYRKHREDIADTYHSIEADLWAGWREDCADEDKTA